MKKTFLAVTLALPFFFVSCDCSKTCGEKDKTADGTTAASCNNCGKSSCDKTCSDKLSGKPIPSCSLDADAQNKRGEEVISKTFSKATAIRELPDGYDLVFAQSPEMVAELNEIAAFERKCCASFKWEISEDAAQKQVHLKVFGSPVVKKELKPAFEQFGLGHLMQK